MVKKGLRILSYSLAALALCLSLLRFTGYWDKLLSEGPAENIDFATLELSDKPNQFLLCPADLCGRAQAHLESPTFEMPLGDLRRAFTLLVKAEAGVETTLESPDGLNFVVRTPLLRWPDWVTVQFIDLGEDRSTLAVYSRSVYGRSDFGANGARVARWLAQLK